MASYEYNTFISKPGINDNRLRIYDKYINLRYTIEPSISFFYKDANTIIINIEDGNNIILDFSTSDESSLSLVKLNEYKQYLLSQLSISEGKSTSDIFSPSNLNMNANITVNDGDLACDISIIDKPLLNSYVRVFINGIEVNTGGKTYPYDCYFSSDGGITIRNNGDERIGDKLYWNGSIAEYNLDQTDLIDFVFLTKINI